VLSTCSYVALRIMDHMCHGCVFGHPLVTQDRNPHNYFVDHEKERIGLEAGGILCKMLRSITLTNHTYLSCAVELIDKLEAAVAASEELKPNAGAVKWVNDMISTYRAWFATMRRLGAQ
jgi:methionine-rich copper-binding protein CopC